MAKDNKKNKKLKIKDVGSNLSLKELEKLQKASGKNPLAIMSKALDKGVSLGRKVVNSYNQPGGLRSSGFNYRYEGIPDNLAPIKGLELGKGQVYNGSSSYTTPGQTGKMWNSPKPSTTTFNPIVTLKNAADGGGKKDSGKNNDSGGKTKDPYGPLDPNMRITGFDPSGPGPLANPNTQTWSGNTPTTTTTEEPETPATPETPQENLGPGMLTGGGLGATGANKLNRAKSRLYRLGLFGRGTGLFGRGLQYGNALNIGR